MPEIKITQRLNGTFDVSIRVGAVETVLCTTLDHQHAVAACDAARGSLECLGIPHDRINLQWGLPSPLERYLYAGT